MEKHYDLIVIGAGPGGYMAALYASKAGKRTAVIERSHVGGTCLNCGCIPTKTYLHTTGLFREVKKTEAAGLHTEGMHVSMAELKKRKDAVVEELRAGIEKQLAAAKIDLYRGNGVVCGDHLVKVMPEGEELTAEYILLAAGSEPSSLPIPGMDLPGVKNSTGILEEETVPDRLIIIGGGVIGMEFATVYNDLGCQVTVLEAMDKILPGMDKEISQNLKMIMKKRGVEIHTGAMVSSIEKMGDGTYLCRYTEKEKACECSAPLILSAVGRRPCDSGLFSGEMQERIKMERGRILVDERGETSVPGIYAAGDVIGGVCLAHVASAEGYRAVSAMFPELKGKDMAVIPSCVYTDPESACAGLTADEAKAAGIEAVTGKYIMSVNGKSVLSMQDRGFLKIVAEKDTGRILGAGLMCARATDMIGELELAVSKGLTAEDLAAVIMPHPTFCEGIGEAAESLCMEKKNK